MLICRTADFSVLCSQDCCITDLQQQVLMADQ